LPSADGKPRVGLRVEHTKPFKVGDAEVLSELDIFAIDCPAEKLQMQSITGYDGRNLSGAHHEQKPSDAWLATSTRPALTEGITKACTAPTAQVAQR